jgi:hypothetical protein
MLGLIYTCVTLPDSISLASEGLQLLLGLLTVAVLLGVVITVGRVVS